MYADFNNLESVRQAVGHKTVAILLEAVQGEGGILPADPDFLRGIRRLCDERNVLMFCDEVQCGMGRTGHWFGYQAADAQPDAFSLAKGLGGGFPIGAIVTGPKLADVFQPGRHASTFGGTPLACAAALAVVNTIEEEGLVAQAAELGEFFMTRLARLKKKLPFIRDVRGRGLMVGLVLDRPAKPLEQKLTEKGLLSLATAETVIRFLPPLTVKKSEISRAVKMVEAACRELGNAP